MNEAGKPITILMAEDDPDDRLLARQALKAERLANDLHIVEDGAELMDYLYRRGNYSDPAAAPRPGLILLDLNMPKLDGREALAQIKADPGLRRIPVVILTTSKAEEDVCSSYDNGASSYITKPVSFEGLANVIQVLGKYWFEIVELPSQPAGK